MILAVKIRELSLGSYVRINLGRFGMLTGMVGEITASRIGVFVIEKMLVPERASRFFTIGKQHRFKHHRVEGIDIDGFHLQRMDFVPADRTGWQLMYYYGDMKLLYRHDKNRRIASFRFMSDYTKNYTRINCNQIHQLQNIMRFLTNDLEFEYYQANKQKNGTDEK